MKKYRWFFLFILLFIIVGCVSTKGVVDKASVEQEAVLGIALLRQGYPNKARFWLQAALRQAPRDAVLWDAWAYWLEDAGRIQLADKAYRQALKHNNHRVTTYNNYASFLCHQHGYQHAMTMFSLAIKKSVQFDRSSIVANQKHCRYLASISS